MLKKLLESALTALQPGLAKKDINEECSQFIFGDNFISTCNGKVCVYMPMETGINCSVNSADLLKTLKAIDDDEIELELSDDKLIITSKSTDVELASRSSAGDIGKFIKGINHGKLKFTELPKDFLQGLELCAFSTTKDVTSRFHSVFCDGKAVFSTDTYRVSVYELAEEDENLILALPYYIVQELIKYPVVGYCQKDDWFHFETEDGAVFGGLMIQADPFDYEAQLETFDEEDAEQIKLSKELKPAIDSISWMSNEAVEVDKVLDLTFHKEKITMKMAKESGKIQKTLPCNYKGKKLTVKFVPRFLSQILEKATTMQISGEQAMFKTKGFVHLMHLPVEE